VAHSDANGYSNLTLEVPGLPETGFAPNRITSITEQPLEKAYCRLGNLWLSIPKLDLRIPIVGIPLSDDGWEVSWLSNQAGYLSGTASPTWAGNTVITSHVYLANGLPGPFVSLSDVRWGDQIYIEAYGFRYTYEVQEVRFLAPNDSSVLRYEEYDWLTLLTCRGYDEGLQTYGWRFSVRAVVIEVSH
jgi:LPXTG-site transpeptidase (sortase) family protein